MIASSEKLENCEVCGVKKAIYTCPKCEVRTCCLQCVNIHKKELECDGVRDKTKFVPLDKFTDLDLLSDYRFLEEVGRSVDQLQKDKFMKCNRSNTLPAYMYKLKQAAYHRGVRLEFMPPHFSRHKENSTYLNWRKNELFWRIEWIFPQAENIKWVTERALESTRLSELIDNVLNFSINNSDDVAEFQRRKILHNKLQFYRATGLSGTKVLLKAERVKNSDSKFYELDVTLSMKENLARKTIIEFPSIFVILKDHSDMYEIIESDDEQETAEDVKKSTHRRKRGNGKNQTKDTKKPKKETVNFFFNNSSDSDEESTNVM